MNKKILVTTGSLIGVVAIGTTVGMGVYWNKYKDAKNALEDISDASFVEVHMHNGANEQTKLYEVKGESNLQELMSNHSADFGLSGSNAMGKYLRSVFGETLSDPMTKFWQLRSQTYIKHHPEQADKAVGSYIPAAYALGVGISGFVLTSSEIVDIYAITV